MMAFHVRDAETDALVRKLAAREGVGLTEAVKRAVSEKLRADESEVPVRERVRKIQEEIARYPATGLKADKAFFDDMSGE
jgi:antitoxin VapB